jgi:hypothetical protein
MPKNSAADPGCFCRIPDMNFSIQDPGFKSKRSRIQIRIKEFKYFIPGPEVQKQQIPDPQHCQK